MNITLCVCTYNRGERIVETLETLTAAATKRLDEVLVIDNNSNDGTARAIDGYARSCAGVQIRRVFEDQQGLTHARARAMRENRSALFAFIDDDVLLDPGWIDAVVSRFDHSERIGAVGGIVEIEWEAGPTKLALERRSNLAYQHMGDAPFALREPRDGLAGAALALRASAVAESGWPGNAVLSDRVGDTTSSAGDYEILARIRRAGYEAWYEPGARCRHLIDASRQTDEYLLKLGVGIAGSMPWYDWVCAGEPTGAEGIAWAERELIDTQQRLARTKRLEVRPKRRRFRIQEREASVRAYQDLIARLESEK